MDCATVVKRGYLFDKKIGIIPVPVDRKRWYILRQDLAQGYCVLEYYKDEKTATKRDPPKGFINVHDVVAVRRVPEKKQTFEILCPGVAYRLMANSDMEADEWAESLSKLILYRKDVAKSLSLRRIPSSPTHTETMGTIPERPRTLSDSYMPSHHTQSHTHPKSLTIPTPTHHPHHHTTDTVFHFSHSPHTTNLSHSLPTPPEMTMSPPTLQYYPPNMQRQRSNEFVVSLPSPSTSSDSSSMCSGSNVSFDTQALFEGDKSDARSRFRVHVKEADNLCISGPADLVVSEEGIALHSIQTGQELVSWPIGSLRRYGVNNVCFTILTGRYCSTGEGRFQFYTPHCRLINTKVHSIAMAKANGNKSIPRRASEPTQMSEMMSRSPQQSHLLPPHSSLPPRAPSTSPPSSAQQYSRVQHSVVVPLSQEQYGKIHHQHTSGSTIGPTAQDYSKLQHFSNSMLSLQSCTQSAMAVPISNSSHITNNNFTTNHNPGNSPQDRLSAQKGKPPSSNSITNKSPYKQSSDSFENGQFQSWQSNV